MENVEEAYMKIDVFVPETILRRSNCLKTKEHVGRSKLIQMNLTEPDVGFFMNLTH